jgi:hypothetical protein
MKNLSLPSNIQKALTTTAKGLLNRYRKDAVCDSGATNHFIPESFQGGEEDTTRNGLEVGCANNQIIESVSTDTLNFTKMNKGSNNCHKFKDEDIADPLLSIPQLTKNGNDILMTEGKVLVIDREREELVSEVLHHVTTAVAQSVVVGAIGAIATADDEAADGYYLVEFTSLPCIDQCAGGTLQCDVNCKGNF